MWWESKYYNAIDSRKQEQEDVEIFESYEKSAAMRGLVAFKI